MTSLGMWLVCLLFQIFKCRFDSSFSLSGVLIKTSWYCKKNEEYVMNMLIAQTTNRMVRNYTAVTATKNCATNSPCVCSSATTQLNGLNLRPCRKFDQCCISACSFSTLGFRTLLLHWANIENTYLNVYNVMELACAFLTKVYLRLPRNFPSFSWCKFVKIFKGFTHHSPRTRRF